MRFQVKQVPRPSSSPGVTASHPCDPSSPPGIESLHNLRWLLLYVPLLVAVLMPVSFTHSEETAGRQARSISPTAQDAYKKAFRLLKSGKASEALAELDATLAKFPSDPLLHNLRGLAASRLGLEEKAEASFRKVIELLPRAGTGYNNLATLFYEKGRYLESAQLFGQALKREPQNLTALVGLGASLAGSGKYSEASPYLERAWGARPEDFQTGYVLARVLRELKRPAEAQKVLDQLTPPQDASVAAKFYTLWAMVAEDRNDRTAASRLYLRAYELDPNSFEIYLSLVRASLGTEDSKSGRMLPPAPPRLSAEQHFALGLLFATRRAYAEAVPNFEETLRAEPASYSATYNLALAYKGAGKGQAAIDLIERALKQHPTAELYNLLASLEEDAGRYVQAVRHFQQAVELDPTNEQYYFDLGAEYLIHFTFAPALDVFRVGAKKFPTSARQHLGMGMAHFALRHYPEAAEAFLSALEIDPSSPSAFAAWNALPPLLASAEWEKILPRLRRLAELHPGSAQALYCYGATLFRHSLASGRKENLDLAQSFLERAIRLKPRFANAYLELATLHAERKEYEKAVAAFLEAIRLGPNSEMAHYRLGHTYRDLNQLELAKRELAIYTELSRSRREKMARSRSTIKQFVLAQPASSSRSFQGKAPVENSR